ncbi:hypothetical protein OPT61_g834 [Boeremia exigua]|uniref:Uncharacterized protein n=1 Tax=Boeremia exigua TaxID=749465 RepID=A0ACC2ISF3_9PLEO|nr:hypothetical protein OPT61_g834 [Boeremia exigua]
MTNEHAYSTGLIDFCNQCGEGSWENDIILRRGIVPRPLYLTSAYQPVTFPKLHGTVFVHSTGAENTVCRMRGGGYTNGLATEDESRRVFYTCQQDGDKARNTAMPFTIDSHGIFQDSGSQSYRIPSNAACTPAHSERAEPRSGPNNPAEIGTAMGSAMIRLRQPGDPDNRRLITGIEDVITTDIDIYQQLNTRILVIALLCDVEAQEGDIELAHQTMASRGGEQAAEGQMCAGCGETPNCHGLRNHETTKPRNHETTTRRHTSTIAPQLKIRVAITDCWDIVNPFKADGDLTSTRHPCDVPYRALQFCKSLHFVADLGAGIYDCYGYKVLFTSLIHIRP